LRLAGTALAGAGVAEAAEDEERVVVVGADLAEGVDAVRNERRREALRGERILSLREFGARADAGDRLRTGIDDQLQPVRVAGDVGVPYWRARVIAMLALQLVPLVPARFFVRQVDGPLDVDQLSARADAFDVIAARAVRLRADRNGASLRRLIVVN